MLATAHGRPSAASRTAMPAARAVACVALSSRETSIAVIAFHTSRTANSAANPVRTVRPRARTASAPPHPAGRLSSATPGSRKRGAMPEISRTYTPISASPTNPATRVASRASDRRVSRSPRIASAARTAHQSAPRSGTVGWETGPSVGPSETASCWSTRCGRLIADTCPTVSASRTAATGPLNRTDISTSHASDPKAIPRPGHRRTRPRSGRADAAAASASTANTTTASGGRTNAIAAPVAQVHGSHRRDPTLRRIPPVRVTPSRADHRFGITADP